MPRGPLQGPDSSKVLVTFSLSEKAVLIRLAEEKDMTLPEMIRYCVRILGIMQENGQDPWTLMDKEKQYDRLLYSAELTPQ